MRLENLLELLPKQATDANRWYYELRKQDDGWVCACTSATTTAEQFNNVGATPEEAVTKMLARLNIRIPTMRTVDPDYLDDEVLASVISNLDRANDDVAIAEIQTLSEDEVWGRYLDWHGIIGYADQLRRALDSIREASSWPTA